MCSERAGIFTDFSVRAWFYRWCVRAVGGAGCVGTAD